MSNWLKMAGIGVSLAGAALSFAADQINDKKMRETVREVVKEEYPEMFKEENEKES